jgi:hypothetical protein
MVAEIKGITKESSLISDKQNGEAIFVFDTLVYYIYFRGDVYFMSLKKL